MPRPGVGRSPLANSLGNMRMVTQSVSCHHLSAAENRLPNIHVHTARGGGGHQFWKEMKEKKEAISPGKTLRP